jgi:rubrerythrin
MKEFKHADEILVFAIGQEQIAIDFYTDLAKEVINEEMKKVFIEFAGEEMKHKQRLTRIREEGVFTMPKQQITDLKIADYVTEVKKASSKMSYEDALVLAMKREKAAFKLYMKLAERSPNDELKGIFETLAMEESRHKLRFELEYDEFVLREN